MKFDLKKIPTVEIYQLIHGLVVPRPIALVTTLSPDGRLNAAPFSAYNYLCMDPPIVGLGIAARRPETDEPKDTARNIELTHEFVINVVTEDIGRQMNICGIEFPPDVNELEMADLHTEKSALVKPPRIREAHAAMECRLYHVLTPRRSRIILGEVLGVYVDDQFVDPGGRVLVEELHALGRMNGTDNYVRTRDAFLSIARLDYDQWQRGERG